MLDCVTCFFVVFFVFVFFCLVVCFLLIRYVTKDVNVFIIAKKIGGFVEQWQKVRRICSNQQPFYRVSVCYNRIITIIAINGYKNSKGSI